jgi:hypothetical protein
MGLLDRFRKKKPKAETPQSEKVVPFKKKSEKELATERGEPYVAIVKLDINPDNMHEGAFELDWNDKFVANLVRAGYQMKPNEPEDAIVDRWFQNICRHVVMETWEQEEAIRNSGVYVKTTDLGGGRKEVS